MVGITVSMWKGMSLEPSSLLMMLSILKMELARYLGLDKDNALWE